MQRSVLVSWLALALMVGGCGSGAQSSAPAPTGPPASEVRVGLLEYRLALSASALTAGTVTLMVTNAGSSAHDLRLRQGSDVLGATALLSPGGRETLRVRVSPGRPVRMDCTVPGHAEAGMKAEVAVAA